MKKLILISALSAIAALAQSNVANYLPNPVFTGFDNNGNVLGGGKLCVYQAGTELLATIYTDATGSVPAPNPVTLNASGQARLYGNGNYKLVLQQANGDSYCPGTGAVVWTMDNIYVYSETPSFTTVTAATFNSTATSSTAAIQQSTGNFMITGAGNADFQSTTVTNDFISNATGTSPAVTQASGNFTITGAGDGTFNSTAGNWVSLIGSMADQTAPGAGFAFLDYNTKTGALDYNLGGAGWVQLSVPGANTQVIYNNSGGFGASSEMTYASGTLTMGGGTSTGITAPLFNSSNTGTNNAFITASGDAYIQGGGNAFFNSVTIGTAGNKTVGILTGTGSNTDTSGIVTLSGGTATQVWPSGHTYTTNPTCVANDFTGVHAVSVGASATQLLLNGNGGDQLQYICVGGEY